MSSGPNLLPDDEEALESRFPTAYTILFLLIIVIAALTWIIPAGQYERILNPAFGRVIAVAGSFAEETLAFYAILILVMIAAGFAPSWRAVRAGYLRRRAYARCADWRGDQTGIGAAAARQPHGLQSPVSQALLPLDAALLDDLHRPWVSRSLPQVSLPDTDLLAALILNLGFAALYRAAAEALVTENAARLARMQQSEQSVDENLEGLKAETRIIRQSDITTELLDVIVGFEALKGSERRRKRKDAASG